MAKNKNFVPTETPLTATQFAEEIGVRPPYISQCMKVIKSFEGKGLFSKPLYDKNKLTPFAQEQLLEYIKLGKPSYIAKYEQLEFEESRVSDTEVMSSTLTTLDQNINETVVDLEEFTVDGFTSNEVALNVLNLSTSRSNLLAAERARSEVDDSEEFLTALEAKQKEIKLSNAVTEGYMEAAELDRAKQLGVKKYQMERLQEMLEKEMS